MISNATIEQVQNSFRNPAPTPSSSPVLPSPGPSAAPVSPVGNNVENQQREMVRQFIQQSGMNAEFSTRCLIDNNWDYEKAGQVFTDLRVSSNPLDIGGYGWDDTSQPMFTPISDQSCLKYIKAMIYFC